MTLFARLFCKKTLAGFLSFPFIILSNRDGFYFLINLPILSTIFYDVLQGILCTNSISTLSTIFYDELQGILCTDQVKEYYICRAYERHGLPYLLN
jgi:hypothetical protein